MARYPSDRKQLSRSEILTKASRAIRQDGVAASGLRSLMAAAGLTHGGFYAHFQSKDDLMRQSIEVGMQQTYDFFVGLVEGVEPSAKLERLVKAYLSMRHRDEIATGCMTSALIPEIARGSVEVRDAFARQKDQFIALIASSLSIDDPEERSEAASAIFATMLGSLQLARAESDPAIAKSILQSGRAAALKIATSP